jgi:hypothetical protein
VRNKAGVEPRKSLVAEKIFVGRLAVIRHQRQFFFGVPALIFRK